MNYHLKSKFGRFVSDYGLLCTYIGFLILAAIYLITENIAYGFSSLWMLGGVIVSYIDYKVEHIEAENHRERDIILAEMKQDFFKVKCMLDDLKAPNSTPLE